MFKFIFWDNWMDKNCEEFVLINFEIKAPNKNSVWVMFGLFGKGVILTYVKKPT